MLLAETGRRTKTPDWAFVDDNNAREARKLAQRGVKVSIGAHGQQAGVGAHWELGNFVRGGMSPVEALKAGTIVPAQSLGMAKDIGSIGPNRWPISSSCRTIRASTSTIPTTSRR